MSTKRIYKSKEQLILFVLIASAFFWPTALESLFPHYDKSLLPSGGTSTLSALGVILTHFINNRSAKILAGLWITWFYIGCTNTVASSLILRSYYSNLNLEQPGRIHLIGCIVVIVGILFHQKVSIMRPQSRSQHANTPIQGYSRASPLIRTPLILFPIAWLISMRLNVGYFPILTGDSIESEMYATNYGVLYNYSFLLAPIAILLYEDSKRINKPNRAALLFLIVVLISLADGKRAIALTSLSGLFLILLSSGEKGAVKKILFALLFAMFVYTTVQIVRTGGDTSRLESDSLAYFMKVGVEYRDFAYTANYIPPGLMVGYNWVYSSIGAFVNGGVLSVLGFDKTYMIGMGSAQVWAQFFNSDFGIRTGIISELWFEFGFAYVFPLLCFGFLVNFVCVKLQPTKQAIPRAILATVYGLLILSVVGQSTVLFGVLTILLYLYLAFKLERIFFGSKRNTANRGSK